MGLQHPCHTGKLLREGDLNDTGSHGNFAAWDTVNARPVIWDTADVPTGTEKPARPCLANGRSC